MRLGRLFLVGIVVILALGVVASARNQFGVSDQNQITFNNPVYVGTTLLPKGDYQVLHTMQGNDHIMVFKQINTRKPIEAKIKCALKPLKAKAPDTRKNFVLGANNEYTLHELTFQGDTATHVF